MFAFLLAATLAFPPHVAELPVTPPVAIRAPLSQTGARIASNGSIALVVWNSSGAVIASRTSMDGTPLDAEGLVVSSAAELADVLWNGAAFVVVARAVQSTDLIFVSTDGAVVRRVSLDATIGAYATNTGQDANTRLLFLPGDGSAPDASLVDANGNVIKRGEGTTLSGVGVAAWNGERFLVLRSIFPPVPAPPYYLSETMDRDGNVVTSMPTQVPFAGFPTIDAVAGDARGGFALIRRDAVAFTWYHLNADGVADRGAVTLAVHPHGAGITPPFAVITPDGFVATWAYSLNPTSSTTYVSHDGSAPEASRTSWIGLVSATAVDSRSPLLVTTFNDITLNTGDDVFVQNGNGGPQLLSRSPAVQTSPALAAGANGFVAVWTENADGALEVMARRFAQDGTPQDEARAAIETAMRDDRVLSDLAPAVAASSDAYLIAADSRARRVDARSGAWIDSEPFALPGLLAIGANSHDALAVTADGCDASSSCISARRIPMHDEPASDSPHIVFSAPAYVSTSSANLHIASDGTDYLLTWTDGVVPCPIPEGCPVHPTRILALRLHADGTPIDPAPIELDAPPDRTPGLSSVAWNGSAYLVAWTQRPGEIAGAKVSPGGAVEQLGVIAHAEEARVVAYLDTFALLTRHTADWSAMFIGGDEVPLIAGSLRPIGIRPPAAAANGSVLMLAYDRFDDGHAHADRVFLDPRTAPSRRRLVTR